MQFPYGNWMPDAQETAQGILMVCDGVMPLVEGYGPAPSLTAAADATALAGAPHGLISMFLRDGTNVVFAFTETEAYELTNTYSWILRGGPFTLTVGDDWSLAQFGNMLLATNTSQGLMQYDIENPTAFTAIAEAGDPREIFICANTVVALDCLDDSGLRDNRLLRTSVVGNQTDFQGPGSDYQQLEDGGRLVGGLDLKNNAGLIFQDNAIRIIQFGATSTGAFTLQKVSDGRGSVGRRSIVGLDGVAYWLSTDGFKSYSGGTINHIGAGFIDEWFLSRVDQANLTEVQASLDPANKLVIWRFPTLNNTTPNVSDGLIGYSWQFGKWFTWPEMTAYLGRIATPGYTLDGMDGFGPLDGIDIPLDSRFWQGGQPVFAALDEDFKYATFTGTNFEATLETGVSNAPVAGLINRATPIDDAAGGTLAVGVKKQLAGTLVFKTGTPKTSAGYVNTRATGFNIAWRRSIPADDTWSYAKGVDYASGGGSARR